MFLYVLQLFDTSYKDDLVLAMTSSGIKESTIIEGINLDHVIQSKFPVLSELLPGKDGGERLSLIMFGTVDERESMIAFLDVLTQAGITNRQKEIFKLNIVHGERLA